jgi:hypothetical protein
VGLFNTVPRLLVPLEAELFTQSQKMSWTRNSPEAATSGEGGEGERGLLCLRGLGLGVGGGEIMPQNRTTTPLVDGMQKVALAVAVGQQLIFAPRSKRWEQHRVLPL